MRKKMIKKHLLMIAALGAAMGVASANPATSSPTTSTVPSTAYTSSASAMAARSAFIHGWFIGLNPGWQQNKISGKLQSANFSSPALGAHIDYNHLISNPVFIGVGLDANYCFKKKKLADGSTLRKDLSGALTARLGVVSGPVAFNVNIAVVVAGFKAKDSDGTTESQTRTGFAPGVGITFCVAKNFTAGLNYRYEVYPKKGDSKPRINSHNIFAKLSYSLSK